MILVDTHIAYWAITNSENLPNTARALFQSEQRFCFSVASVWEIELKHRKNPDKVPLSGKQFYLACLDAGMTCISVRAYHIFELENLLKDKNYHEDPFDHLLLAVAKSENHLLLTHDEKMNHYPGVNVIMC